MRLPFCTNLPMRLVLDAAGIAGQGSNRSLT